MTLQLSNRLLQSSDQVPYVMGIVFGLTYSQIQCSHLSIHLEQSAGLVLCENSCFLYNSILEAVNESLNFFFLVAFVVVQRFEVLYFLICV